MKKPPWVTGPALDVLVAGDGLQPGDEVKFDRLQETGGLGATYNRRVAVVTDQVNQGGVGEWLLIKNKVRFVRRESFTYWIWRNSRLIAWRRPTKGG